MKTYVLVTGATGGIGSAVIRRLLPETEVDGVLGVCRNTVKWNQIFEPEQGQYGSRLVPIATEAELFQEQVEVFLQKEKKKTDWGDKAQMILVLSAFSLQPAERIISIKERELAENLRANLEEPIRQIQAALQLCRQYGLTCRIIYLGSGAAHRPLNGWALYGAGKNFMHLFLQTLAQEEALQTVFFDPGVVDTAMQEQIRSIPEKVFDQVKTFQAYHMRHQLHSAAEVADYLVKRYVLAWEAQEYEERYRKV